MSDNIKVEVKESIFDANDKIAEKTNKSFNEKGIFAVNVMGAPGCGKTSSIISISKQLPTFEKYVFEGDIESDIDTKLLNDVGIDAIQINTHGSCHLDAPIISEYFSKLDKRFSSEGKDKILFIENIGNLVCPAEFMIGEHIKMLIVTVTDGSDKPYKYPLAFENADVIILNKIDLIPYVNFDEEFFMKGIRFLNKDVSVFKVSATKDDGFEEVADWLKKKAKLL